MLQRTMACSRSRQLLLGIWLALFQVSKSQTDVERVCAALNCSLATYILIGIAILYFVFSIVCLVLIAIACNCKRRPRLSKVRPSRNLTENDLDDVFIPSDLDPIGEATTTTDLNLNYFENSHAQEDSDIEHSSSSEEEDKKVSSESDQDTSFVIKNPSATKNRHKSFTRSLGKNSPLLFHQPKSSPVPPAKVKVPFSESAGPGESLPPARNGRGSLPPLETTPRQRSKAAVAALSRSNDRSPFSRRKNPLAEIPKDDDKKSTPKVNHMQLLQSQSSSTQKKGGVAIPESTLKFEMVKVSHKWRLIGTMFQLPSSMLNNISIIYNNDNDTCMLHVCTQWVKVRQRDWTELIDILKLKRIDEKQLANYLQSTYLKTGTSNGSQEELAANNSEGSLSWYFNHGSQNATHESPASNQREEEADELVSWID